MSTSLYNEALNAAEELKFATEERVKQNLIEAMTPQIKLMVEQNIMSEIQEDDESSYESDVKEDDECGYESDVKEDDECGYESDDDANPRTSHKKPLRAQDEDKNSKEEDIELSVEARSILSKVIDNNSKRAAINKKLAEIKNNIITLKKAVLLSENSNNNKKTQKRINQIYKNLVNEMKNISSYDIIKKDKVLLNEFYKVIKELNNMSRRQSKKNRYLNEDLESLLEMNLFEEEEEDSEEDSEEEPSDVEDSDLMDDEPMLSDDDDMGGSVTPETTVEELAAMAGITSEGDMDEDMDEDMGEDMDLADEDMEESFFESDKHDESDEDNHEGLEASERESYQESSRRGGDLFLEIDENMLKREISKMKRLREGEAKDMASHFGGGSLEGEMFVDGVELNKLHEMKIKAAKVVRQNRKLNSTLSQYKKALRGMKGQLAEMNLFNAKLLYANKLMQNKDLSMKQQRHIVESLDEAKTLGEAKILFESLSKGLIRRTTNTNSKNLTEGTRRRTTGSASRPVRSAQVLKESVALDRWATLAGIK